MPNCTLLELAVAWIVALMQWREAGRIATEFLLKSLMGQENCESGGHEKAHWGLDSGCWHSLVNS